ncbi:MAG: hypothetical protein FJW30_14955 [Acidobacteria bacterium]|nr:hypothetical protein [Acidobacteriota bacterium]
MSAQPIPEYEGLSGRPFSFYPPILNIDNNEWNLSEATWSEVLVRNTRSSLEIWVPRRYLGAVSRVDEPVMIVGLQRELEYANGILRPHERRVLNMPKAPYPPTPVDEASIPKPAMVAGVRLGDSGSGESRIGLYILAGIVAFLFVVYGVVSYNRGDRIQYQGVLQEDLGFTAEDDVFAVTRKLGPPARDRWSEGKDLQYRALEYPDRHFTVILMGTAQNNARYIGAVNDDWRPVHTVKHAGNGNTRSLLEGLKRF